MAIFRPPKKGHGRLYGFTKKFTSNQGEVYSWGIGIDPASKVYM